MKYEIKTIITEAWPAISTSRRRTADTADRETKLTPKKNNNNHFEKIVKTCLQTYRFEIVHLSG